MSSWGEEITRAVRAYLEDTNQPQKALGPCLGVSEAGVARKLKLSAWSISDVDALCREGVQVPLPGMGVSKVPGFNLVAHLEGQEQACLTLARTMRAGAVAMVLTEAEMGVVLTEIDAVKSAIQAQLNVLTKGSRS